MPVLETWTNGGHEILEDAFCCYSTFSQEMFLAATGVIFSFCLRSILAQSTRDIGQLFEINGLVPDLLQSFDPTVLLQVSYSFTLVPGEILSQNGIKYVINV